jgi:ParB-like chromosome segregation protein Spo0J
MMRVRQIPLDDLKPYEQNPRKNDAAVPHVLRSIREFGFNQPIVCDENMVIIVGHTRWKAAKELALEKAPCFVVDHLNEEQKRAYRIADNKTAEAATWDFEKLIDELRVIGQTNEDFSNLGFSETELEKLLGPLDGESTGLEGVEVGGDRFLLHVEFATESELSEAYEECKKRGWDCKLIM